jgi:hypothetical protein
MRKLLRLQGYAFGAAAVLYALLAWLRFKDTGTAGAEAAMAATFLVLSTLSYKEARDDNAKPL